MSPRTSCTRSPAWPKPVAEEAETLEVRIEANARAAFRLPAA